MQEKNDERDEFWDLAKLVPKKNKVIPGFVSRSSLSDYIISGEKEEKRDDTRINYERYESSSAMEEWSYTPQNYPLISRVTVKRFNDKYDFYGSFRKAAEVYFDYKTEKCEFAPFYSYMPQYSQLTREQKSYYFYWRDCIRRGKFIKTDYSYIYLFVYEILNLPEKIPPNEGVLLLCNLWKEYRSALRRIDSYFAVWIQDYCLIYDLKCPMEIIRDFIFDVIEVSSFKEFFLSDTEETSSHGVDSMVAYLSDYDWRRGKFVSGEHSELYKKCMRGAMGRVISEAFKGGVPKDGQPASITREAFPHSLCTHAVKCRLTIEYYPVARDTALRDIFTGSVRYTENKLRGLIGIKSRLAVRNLDDRYKSVIDGYFSELLTKAEKKRDKASAPVYEKMYDAEDFGFSSYGADEIEKMSWNTTLRLIPEEEKNEILDVKMEQNGDFTKTNEGIESRDEKRDSYGLSQNDIAKIALSLDSGFSDDSIAERINEAFYSGFGDIILELDGDRYVIIEDYREEINEWLKRMK